MVKSIDTLLFIYRWRGELRRTWEREKKVRKWRSEILKVLSKKKTKVSERLVMTVSKLI